VKLEAELFLVNKNLISIQQISNKFINIKLTNKYASKSLRIAKKAIKIMCVPIERELAAVRNFLFLYQISSNFKL
jgi:hypothetical protein